jgi:glycosyltransferase involved in cell wall biosynthesis
VRVLLLSRHGQLGASSRARSYQYLPYLVSQGIEVTVSPFFEDEYLVGLHAGRGRSFAQIVRAYLRRLAQVRQRSRFDAVWVEYEGWPWLPAWCEPALLGSEKPYLVDYDDAVFHNYDAHPRWIVRALLGGKISELMRRAAVVAVGNEYLAEHARRAGARNVELIPTVVNLDRYPCIPQAQTTPETFTIGWIGSPFTVKYLEFVRSALAEVCRTDGARLVVVGVRDVRLDGVPTVVRPWSEATEGTEISAFDVGIMPLPDGPWERGKCGYKLIQYMACGRPVVASPVGVNTTIVEHGVNGLLAATVPEWIAALTRLRKDPVLRRRMGQAGRAKVESQYSLQVTAPRLAAVLRDLCSGRLASCAT